MLGETVELYLVSAGLDVRAVFPFPDQYSQYNQLGVPFEFAQYLQDYEDNAFQSQALPCGFLEIISEGQNGLPVVPTDQEPPPPNNTNAARRRRQNIPDPTDFPDPTAFPESSRPPIPRIVPSGAVTPFGIIVVNLTVTNETSQTFTGLCPFTTYNFSVSAVNRAGGGRYAQVAATTFEDGEYVSVQSHVCVFVCGSNAQN